MTLVAHLFDFWNALQGVGLDPRLGLFSPIEHFTKVRNRLPLGLTI
jgi:hypothetical protein